eukprot:CAMPEP_0178965322 /NCGR_PEP_ID=MMETSP0789-20121207/16216_1 /TAXON_ID=3005 /ORGANISM="Rhizosolenia setigera, Strain CCMP 1694" /LENGTH=148 /DNA_ID=CAMNT_0020650291 /DNA_START=58 /DNA_END=504 /DNA_ORIENTATION=+
MNFTMNIRNLVPFVLFIAHLTHTSNAYTSFAVKSRTENVLTSQGSSRTINRSRLFLHPDQGEELVAAASAFLESINTSDEEVDIERSSVPLEDDSQLNSRRQQGQAVNLLSRSYNSHAALSDGASTKPVRKGLLFFFEKFRQRQTGSE